jgi:formate dehydrogenase subunit gamma
LIPYSGYLLIALLVLFALYFTIKGRIRIQEGRCGREFTRTTSAERWVHWFTAVVTVLMAITGLVLLYGRTVLIPVMGPEAFAAIAEFNKIVHNYLGLLFILAIVLTIIIFLRENLLNLKVDMKWFMTAGGYLGGRHPSAEKYNAGQKAWYWTAAVTGVLLCVTGLILNFPNFEQTRETMQLANIVHVLASAIVIAFLLVHVYLALATEGALQAMTTGRVDENWVKQHHDLWYEELRQTGQETTTATQGSTVGDSATVPREQPS